MCIRKLVTGPEFHAKTLSRSGVIKKNPPGGVYTPSPAPKNGLKGQYVWVPYIKKKKDFIHPHPLNFLLRLHVQF